MHYLCEQNQHIPNMKKRDKILFVAGFVAFFAISAGFIVGYQLLYKPAFGIKKDVYLYIDQDDNIDSIRHKITQATGKGNLTGLKLINILKRYNNKTLNTGCYTITPNETLHSLFRKLQGGLQTPVNLVLPSVRSLEKLATSISKQLMMKTEDITQLLSDSAYIRELGFNVGTLPALFIPNTYEVYWNISPKQLMDRLLNERKLFWNKERLQKAESIGLTPIEVATLASIVDEETNNNREKPTIAGLYINRLQKGMKLQADPTVKYALEDFSLKRILYAHLETESPYNTYRCEGLPPGPIRIPSIIGIESVLNYEKHNYLYMCAHHDLSGIHIFSNNLQEHNRNAMRYQQTLNKYRIR